jgi:autotransporter strand-loop-strand O-heptosyltransferase
MKIINVTPGILPIPPNGWGAVEKIIWEYHQNFIKKGLTSEIKYLDDVNYENNTVVHIHVANLALMAYERKIPYFFTCHDHHAYLYEKTSDCYKQNYDAIKHSIKSFVPAKYLVEYFNLPNLYYLSHGVNKEIFKKINKKHTNHKLLCVANNGFVHDPSEDRKGFGFAIEAAKKLNLPITIAGPKNNKKFFDRFLPNYNKLTILYDLSEEELIKLYQDHTIFLHPSILEAGHPNLTLLEAMSCGLPIIGTFEDNSELEGLIKIKRDVDDISNSIIEVIKNYSILQSKCEITSNKLTWNNITNKLLFHYDVRNSMKEKLIKSYNTTSITNHQYRNILPLDITYHFIDGPFIEIKRGDLNKTYTCNFYDDDKNELLSSIQIKSFHWARPYQKYYKNWRVQVKDGDNILINEKINLKGKRVLIWLDSNSLGDNIAWMPYLEEFRKIHDCHVIASTFYNNLFIKEYPNIEFVSPGIVVDNIFASFKIGCFENNNEGRSLSPTPWNIIPLQQICSDILGLKYIEIRPKISCSTNISPINDKYVCIGIESTAQCKLWNNPDGWQKTVDYLNCLGYKVVSLKKSGTSNLKNVIEITDNPLAKTIDYLTHCELFIGLGSGLSWVAHALNKKVVLISGFSEPWCEFTTPYRVINKNVCYGCFNDQKIGLFDKSWEWCPRNKEFECTKEITFEMVKDKINIGLLS